MILNSKKINYFSFTLLLLLGLFVSTGFAVASNSSGTIDNAFKYSWSNNGGWINFGCDNCAVSITDTALTGYAWSENFGWINLNPSGSGVKNNSEGVLSGSAWGENVGWIDFSGVAINTAGQFTGTATNDSLGTVNFNCTNCTVKTDWRPLSARGPVVTPPPNPPGSSPSSPSSTGGQISGSFNINDGQTTTNNQIVKLTIGGASDIQKVEISNLSNLFGAIQEQYEPTKSWDLCAGQEEICKNLPADGKQFTVYVKLFNSLGQSSDIISASINFDNKGPSIFAVNIKSSYLNTEDIIVSGTGDANSTIGIFWDGQYGQGHADSSGNWSFNLGTLAVGNYQLKLVPKDQAGNNGVEVDRNFSVSAVLIPPIPPTPPANNNVVNPPANNNVTPPANNNVTPPASNNNVSGNNAVANNPPPVTISDRLRNIFNSFLPGLFGPTPERIATVPLIAPLSMNGQWTYLSQQPLDSFIGQSLPPRVLAMAQKFPQIAKTLKDLGITKTSDLALLELGKIVLPGLTDAAGMQNAGLLTGIPLSQLTDQAKKLIPDEILFARTAGGLIDYETTLAFNSNGDPEQFITTIDSTSLNLVIKTSKPVSSITGVIASNTGDKVASLDFSSSINDGIYTADVQKLPAQDSKYTLTVAIDYSGKNPTTKNLDLVLNLRSPGRVLSGVSQDAVNGANVSLYWLNPQSKNYEVWPGSTYSQINPQTTGTDGSYIFIAPKGSYYFKTEAQGYNNYEGKVILVKEAGGINQDIILTQAPRAWWQKALGLFGL